MAHDTLLAKSSVLYPLSAGLRKVGDWIRGVDFEADKKSFVSVPVSVTEVKLFDWQVEGIIWLNDAPFLAGHSTKGLRICAWPFPCVRDGFRDKEAIQITESTTHKCVV